MHVVSPDFPMRKLWEKGYGMNCIQNAVMLIFFSIMSLKQREPQPMQINEVFPNPTVKQVIFQIRFPNLFYLESKIGEYQLKIMQRFPESVRCFPFSDRKRTCTC